MKILKHGETVLFHCKVCGCEFVEGTNATEDLGFYIRVYCPECGSEVQGHVSKEVAHEQPLPNADESP